MHENAEWMPDWVLESTHDELWDAHNWGVPLSVENLQSLFFHKGIKSCPMILVFGCRQSEMDHIYKEETLQAKNKGVFKELYTAYSREPGKPKVLHLVPTPAWTSAAAESMSLPELWEMTSSFCFLHLLEICARRSPRAPVRDGVPMP